MGTRYSKYQFLTIWGLISVGFRLGRISVLSLRCRTDSLNLNLNELFSNLFSYLCLCLLLVIRRREFFDTKIALGCSHFLYAHASQLQVSANYYNTLRSSKKKDGLAVSKPEIINKICQSKERARAR